MEVIEYYEVRNGTAYAFPWERTTRWLAICPPAAKRINLRARMILRWRRAGATDLDSSRPIGAHQIQSMKRANHLSALSFVEPIVKLALSLSRASRLWSVSCLEQDGKASIC